MLERSVLYAAILLFAASTTANADEAACTAARYVALGKYRKCQSEVDLTQDGAFLIDHLACRSKYAAAYDRMSMRLADTSCAGPRFVDNGDGTVTDNLTRLVWETKTESPGPQSVYKYYRWSDGGSGNADGTIFSDLLAEMNLNCFAGHCDWRVPTLYELQTILAPVPCDLGPCVADPLLLPMKSSPYVSASQRGFTNSGVGFDNGDGYSIPCISSSYYRVVRGGL